METRIFMIRVDFVSFLKNCLKRILSRCNDNVRPASGGCQYQQQRIFHLEQAFTRGGQQANISESSRRLVKPDLIPGYTLMGVCLLSAALGPISLEHKLLHNPQVFVDKKKRRTVAEVEYPDYVVHKSEKYVPKSFFRRFAQKTRVYHNLAQHYMPWIVDPSLVPSSSSTIIISASLLMLCGEFGCELQQEAGCGDAVPRAYLSLQCGAALRYMINHVCISYMNVTITSV